MDNKRQEELRCCCSTKEDSLLHPDPDPETERMIAEKEDADNRTPDDLLIDAMKNACSLLEEAAREARRTLMSPGEMNDLLGSASGLLNTIAYLHVRVSVQKTTDKLRFMREVEQRNDESIKRWAENEALHEAAHGDEGTGRPWD